MKLVLLSVLVVLISGCGTVTADPPPDGGQGGSGGKVSVTAMGGEAGTTIPGTGGGSGSGGNGDQATAFAGAWTLRSGALPMMCGGGAIAPIDLTGDMLAILRVDPTHVSTMLTGTGVVCDVSFAVTGTVATAISGQTCVVTVPVNTMTVAVTINISSWTLNLSGDTLSISMSGTATAAGILSCTPSATGSATRNI